MGSFLLWTPGYYNKRDSTIASLPVKVYVSQKKSEETSMGQIKDISNHLDCFSCVGDICVVTYKKQ